MKRYVKLGFGIGTAGDTFEHGERVSAGLGTELVKRDHGDQAGVSDISISTPPEVAARKLSKFEAPEMDKMLILIRAGFQEDTVSFIMSKVKEFDEKGRPTDGS